jgi:beta-phosphoglucomutase family hydrolase
LLVHPVPRRAGGGFGRQGGGFQLFVLDRGRLAALALAPGYVQVVEDAEQPRPDAVGLEVEVVGGAECPDERLLDEVLGAVDVARHAAGDAVEHVEVLEREGFELLAVDLHADGKIKDMRCGDGCNGLPRVAGALRVRKIAPMDELIGDDVRGLVFDCDGTIADTMPLHYEAWVAALGEHGVEFPEAMFYEMAGIPTARIIEILNERHGHHMPVQATADYKEELYVKLIPRVRPIEPVVALVERYAGRLPMAVATGGTRAICTKTLASLDLLKHFREIVTADDVKNGKPAPDIFLEAARRIGVPPGECVAFEDADLGVRAARDAGMRVVDVRGWVDGGK